MRDEEEIARRRLSAPLSSHIAHPASLVSRYGPVLIWLAVIFYASTGDFSASNTSRIVGPLVRWLFPEITEPALLQIHFFVRKTAHFFEYAVLALLAARAFLGSPHAGLRRNWHAASFALAAACALLDEYNQSFDAARTGTIYDSLLDMCGAAAALAALALFRRRSLKRTTVEREVRQD